MPTVPTKNQGVMDGQPVGLHLRDLPPLSARCRHWRGDSPGSSRFHVAFVEACGGLLKGFYEGVCQGSIKRGCGVEGLKLWVWGLESGRRIATRLCGR